MLLALHLPALPLQAHQRALPAPSPERGAEPTDGPWAVASTPKGQTELAATRGVQGGALLVEVSAAASDLGLRPGLTVAQGRARVPHLWVVSRSVALEAAALAALADAAGSLSPRVEPAAPSAERSAADGRDEPAAWIYVDARGLEQLFATPDKLVAEAERLARRVGLTVLAGVGPTKALARLAARGGPSGRGLLPSPVLLVPSGELFQLLGGWSWAELLPSPKLAARLSRLGLRSIAELCAIPRAALVERLGDEALRLVRMVAGEEVDGPLAPRGGAERFCESIAAEWGLADLEALAFALKTALDRLVVRLALRGYACGELTLVCDYDGRGGCVRKVPVASPSRDARALLALARLRLAKDPPEAPVVQLDVEADAVPVREQQLSLLEPTGPAPDKLAVTVGRLVELSAEEGQGGAEGSGPSELRVGAPALVDSWRDDDFELRTFAPPPLSSTPTQRSSSSLPSSPDDVANALLSASAPEAPGCARLSLRRFREPRPVEVLYDAGRPVRLDGLGLAGRIVLLSGPYKRRSAWWDTPQSHHPADYDIVDALLADGVYYRLRYEPGPRRWLVIGWYD